MDILITGGAGYIGVVLTEHLLAKGHKVVVLDNFMYGFEPILHLIRNRNLNIVKKDIRNLCGDDLKNYDVIFHLAAISGYPACEVNPHSAQVINIDATRKLVDYIKKSSQLLIYASTTSFYGRKGLDCNEESEVKPVSLYGITKYEAEKIVMSRKNSISLRFATVFGVSPKMRNDLMVNDFTYKAINERSIVIFDRNAKRTFINIIDAIDGYIFTLSNCKKMADNIYNVGDDKLNYTKLDIANEIKKYVKFEIIDSSLSDFDIRNFNISFNKINLLGFSVKRSLEEGIKDLVKLYRVYKQYTPYRTI